MNRDEGSLERTTKRIGSLRYFIKHQGTTRKTFGTASEKQVDAWKKQLAEELELRATLRKQRNRAVGDTRRTTRGGNVTQPAPGIELTKFVQHPLTGTAELLEVERIADELLTHLNQAEARARIAAVHVPGASSRLVQETFLDFARELGFVDESIGLFADYATSSLRPDYFLRLDGTGILLEVERGKTTINNMDLLDFWKCHLCKHADHLFLMVSKELRQNPTMAAKREYAFVVKRLESFFIPANYTNVRGLFVFGY